MDEIGDNSNSNTAAARARDTYSDPSGALFSMYLSRADTFDRDRAESWKADADGILIYTGLFSAVLSTFVLEGLQELQPGSTNPSDFHVSTSVLLKNALWLLSLVASLICALLATLLQHWARRYLLVTQNRGRKLHDRARVRSFFAEGLIKHHLPGVVEALPALLHISVFFFFGGLLIHIYGINRPLFFMLTVPISFCVVAYAGLTFMPILHHSSPYQTPFSTLAWSCCMSILRAVKRVSGYSFIIRNRDGSAIWANVTTPPSDPQGYSEFKLEQSMDRHREASAKKQHWTIDARALAWTLDSMDEDHELEQFAAGMPGLFVSKAVKQPADMLAHISGSSTLHPDLGKDIQKLVTGSSQWADSLHLLPKASREWRDRVCLKALYFIPNSIQAALANAIRGPGSTVAIPPFLNSYESWAVADALRQDPRIDLKIRLDAECVTAVTCARLDPSDLRTLPILTDQLDIPSDELKYYLCDGYSNNLLLAHLIRFVQRIALTGLGERHVIDRHLMTNTLRLLLGSEWPAERTEWTWSLPPTRALRGSFDQTWNNLNTAEANLRTERLAGGGMFSSFDYDRALRNISVMREALQPVHDAFKRGPSPEPLEMILRPHIRSSSEILPASPTSSDHAFPTG